jgi:hypothetical protein
VTADFLNDFPADQPPAYRLRPHCVPHAFPFTPWAEVAHDADGPALFRNRQIRL